MMKFNDKYKTEEPEDVIKHYTYSLRNRGAEILPSDLFFLKVNRQKYNLSFSFCSQLILS